MKRSIVAVTITAVAAALAGILGATRAGADLGDVERIAYQWSQIGVREIRVMHADGAQALDLPAVPGGTRDKITPALSRDGSLIAFATPTEGHFKIWVWELGSDNNPVGQPRQVTFGDTDDEQPAFSPDGTKLAYIAGKGLERTIQVKPLEGNQAPTQVAIIQGGFHSSTPSWSPDGASIVYAQDDGLWTVGLDGEKKQLHNKGTFPAWSFDGQWVAFMVRDDPEKSSLWVVDRDRTAARKVLGDLAGAGGIAWSPDGGRTAFKATAIGDQTGRHWTVKTNGTDLRPLETQNEPSAYLAWAPVDVTTVAVGPGPVIGPGPEPTPEPAGPVKIVSPRSGQTVRGDVKVRGDIPDPEGFVVVRIADAGAGELLTGLDLDAGFRMGIARPFEYEWDTRADGDGEKIIRIDGYDQAAEYMGSATIRVKVENEVKDPVIAEKGVLLEVKFKRDGQKATHAIKGSADSTEEYALDRSQQLAALAPEVAATLVQTVERIDRFTDVTTLRNKLRDATITAGGVRYPLFESAVYARTQLRRNGRIEPLRKTAGERLYLAELCIELPTKVVRIGETWRSPMNVVTELVSRQGVTVQGTHVLERLEWEGKYRCAKIKSTFDLTSVRIPLNIRTGFEEEETGTVPTRYPTMPLPPTAPGWRPTGEEATETTVTMRAARGVRYTWVAYEANQVVRVDDVITGSLDVPSQWLSGLGPAGTGAGTGTSAASSAPYGSGYRPYGGAESAYTAMNYRMTLSSRLTEVTE